MERLSIDLKENPYDIYIKAGITKELYSHIGEAEKWLIITDSNVDPLYASLLEKSLGQQDFYKFVMEAGEERKTFATVEAILSFMIKHQFTRKSKIIALGGGVVGDIAGFAASIYMRGIPWIQVPTTLLAQVDSSVGGKTGINMAGAKNMVGSFYQPDTVIIDPNLLKTLSKKELFSGIGEVIKYGIIYDNNFLKYVDENLENLLKLNNEITQKVIKRCCEIKAAIVTKDEKEEGLRKILNFGHTMGHALEAATHYQKYTHGEAVLLGMHHETLMAKAMGWIDKAYCREITDLIHKTGMDCTISNQLKIDMLEMMEKDKKNTDRKISFVLPTGKATVKEILLSKEEVKSWWL